MKRLIFFSLFIVSIAIAQQATFQSLKVGDQSTIDPSAIMEIKSTTGSLLIPRMTTTQKNAIPSPKNGDMIYDTTLNQFSGYQNGSWSSLGGITGYLPAANFPGLTGDVTVVAGTTTSSLSATTNATLTTLSDLSTASMLSTIGTIGTGVWHGTVVSPTYGGIGVNAGSSTGVGYFLNGVFGVSTPGANGYLYTGNGTSAAPTFQAIPTWNQNTTGTAANITGTSNSTLTTLSGLTTVGTVGTGTWQGTAVASNYGGTGLNSSTYTGVPSIASGTWSVNDFSSMPQTATPTATPASDVDQLYFKSDDNLYTQNHAGTETLIGAGMQGTNPAPYTPTIVGMGTVTGEAFYWWRKGPDIVIQGSFTCGTPTGTPVSITLPGSILSASTLATDQVVGSWSLSGGVDAEGAFSSPALISASSSSFNVGIGVSSSQGGLPADGNIICTSGYVFTVTAEFPVTGWTTTSPTSAGQAGASFFTSPQVTTQSSAITGTSFTTFSNSPTLTFTPTVTGTYKVYSNVGINADATGVLGTVRIFNTSGSATLLSESDAGVLPTGSGANPVINSFAQSVYTLTAGTSYSFDLQGKNSSTGSLYLDGANSGNFYVYAELYAALGTGTTTVGAPIEIGLPQFSDTGLFSQFTSTVAGYAQSIWQNLSSGSTASTDLIVNNDQGTATTHYGDFGINSSGFTGSGSLQKAGATYLYSETGDLVLATNTSNALHILAGNSTADAITITASNTIQFPAMTTAGFLQNDASGNITSLVPPSARYHGFTSGGTGVSGAFTNVLYATKDIDTNSAYSSGIYTCPSTGKYRTTAALYPTAATVTAATKYTLQILVNGAVYAAKDEWFATAATKPINPNLTTFFTCTSGQTVAVQGAYASSETTPSVTASNVYNFFEIKLESY